MRKVCEKKVKSPVSERSPSPKVTKTTRLGDRQGAQGTSAFCVLGQKSFVVEIQEGSSTDIPDNVSHKMTCLHLHTNIAQYCVPARISRMGGLAQSRCLPQLSSTKQAQPSLQSWQTESNIGPKQLWQITHLLAQIANPFGSIRLPTL